MTDYLYRVALKNFSEDTTDFLNYQSSKESEQLMINNLSSRKLAFLVGIGSLSLLIEVFWLKFKKIHRDVYFSHDLSRNKCANYLSVEILEETIFLDSILR